MFTPIKTERLDKGKIRAIIKRPDEKYGHVTNISPSLKNLQKTVDGYIETLTLAKGLVLICNEEGKLRGLESNFRIGEGMFAETIVGTVAVVGAEGDEFVDCPLSFQSWKDLLARWGNT